ncbi:MAG: helix-turn-helix transcriptional regulator [Frankiales bacterium]|nr:helix-turn-helix transcriptional regulator [Frankiales bacterium]
MGASQHAVTTGPNAIGAALGLVGDEWNLLIVRAALTGPRRYTGLQQELGIAPSVLSARLKALIDAGVLAKVPDGARSRYTLTRAGSELWSLLLCIWAWEQRWVQGESLPTMRHADCGQAFAPLLACRGCDAPVESRDVHVELGPAGELSRAVPTGTNRRRGAGSGASGPGLFPMTMSLLGSRWSSALLGTTFLGVRRFTDFEAALGAPPNTVSDRLRTFVALEVLDADYELTDKGRDLFATVSMIVAWGERWFPAPDGPTLLARHVTCGGDFRPVLQCSGCRARLHRRSVRVDAPVASPTLERIS